METIVGGISGRAIEVDINHRLITNGVVTKNSFLLIAAGLVEGVTHINKFGAGVVAGASPETVWDGASLSGITNYTYMTSLSTMYISSDNTNDDQRYEVEGAGADYNFQKVQVTVNGFNFIVLPRKWLRIYRVKNIGTTANAGNIYVSDDNTDVGGNGIPDTLSNVKAMIAVGNSQTLMSVYTVPHGKTAFMTAWHSSCGKLDDMELTLWSRKENGVFQIKDRHFIYASAVTRPFDPYLPFEEKTDIEIKAKIGAAGGNTAAGYDLILMDN